MNQALKFLLSIIIVIVTFVVSATLAGILAEYAGWWKKPVIGGVAAACVVLSGYFSAPVYKLYSAAVWLLIGAVAAWVMSSVFMYAEDADLSAFVCDLCKWCICFGALLGFGASKGCVRDWFSVMGCKRSPREAVSNCGSLAWLFSLSRYFNKK
ncbi:hypothetical protein [Pseudoalteromonas sp. A22]|uniref:hypothetical protein n=1 Tax=Pseudoalteromonas sp. A22 TaxID=327511 RepID=UPI002012A467|nr:hypothetical protein [Pseudoalteromonas sp. A22]